MFIDYHKTFDIVQGFVKVRRMVLIMIHGILRVGTSSVRVKQLLEGTMCEVFAMCILNLNVSLFELLKFESSQNYLSLASKLNHSNGRLYLLRKMLLIINFI